MNEETMDKYNASIALLKHNREAADKLLTRHTVDDCINALEAALKAQPASDPAQHPDFPDAMHSAMILPASDLVERLERLKKPMQGTSNDYDKATIHNAAIDLAIREATK